MTPREIAFRIAVLCRSAINLLDAATDHALSAAESLRRIP